MKPRARNWAMSWKTELEDEDDEWGRRKRLERKERRPKKGEIAKFDDGKVDLFDWSVLFLAWRQGSAC